MDDVWKDISSVPSLHHPTTTSHHFQVFFVPPEARPDGRANTRSPQPLPPPQPSRPLVTMLSLSPTSGNYYSGNDQQALHINTTTVATSTDHHVVKERPPPEYSEKFKRLMKNRESAARSRARKQARANELEQEILRLTKENGKLKRLQKELCSTNAARPRKEPMLHRTRSSPF